MSSPHPTLEQLEELARNQAVGEDLIAHLAGCNQCKSWVETWRLLSETLQQENHPESGDLARYATDASGLDPSLRQSVAEHLASCPACREHLGLVRQSLSRPDRDSVPLVRFALAASLLIFLSLAWVLRPDSTEQETAETLNSRSFRGTHVVEAATSITAESVTVEAGGDVTFRAGESVVLSDGFVIGNGASFQVELAPIVESTTDSDSS